MEQYKSRRLNNPNKEWEGEFREIEESVSDNYGVWARDQLKET